LPRLWEMAEYKEVILTGDRLPLAWISTEANLANIGGPKD